MTAIARLEVVLVGEERLSDSNAQAISALDGYDVRYETTAIDTIIEAETTDELFAAVKAAHGATPGGRVITSVEIDDMRGRDQHASDPSLVCGTRTRTATPSSTHIAGVVETTDYNTATIRTAERSVADAENGSETEIARATRR